MVDRVSFGRGRQGLLKLVLVVFGSVNCLGQGVACYATVCIYFRDNLVAGFLDIFNFNCVILIHIS